MAVYSFGRKESQRCPNKLLRPFGDTTLTDIMLGKLRKLGSCSFFAGYEEEFRKKCEAADVAFVRRDKNSTVIDEPIIDIQSFLRDVKYEYLLWVNPCLPFLRVETIKAFLDGCVKAGYVPTFPVTRRATHFIRSDRSAVNFDAACKTLNTKTVEPLYEMVHASYFFNRRFFLENGTYWEWADVRTVEVANSLEFIDIDTEEDFAAAEALWKAGGK